MEGGERPRALREEPACLGLPGHLHRQAPWLPFPTSQAPSVVFTGHFSLNSRILNTLGDATPYTAPFY